MPWWNKYNDAYNRAMNAYETGWSERLLPSLDCVYDWHHMLDMGGEL